jgi:hypothetical protein
MTYTVFYDPTNSDYKWLKKAGYALDRSRYPVVTKSGFESYEDAKRYVDSQVHPGAGKSIDSFDIKPGSYPEPDMTPEW